MEGRAELFAARVLEIRSSGKVDAEYAIGGKVGVFWTAEEHGLKVLKVGGVKKVCSEGGLSQQSPRERTLHNTLPKKPCSTEGPPPSREHEA